MEMVTVIPIASSDSEKKPITIIFKGKGKGNDDKNLVNRAGVDKRQDRVIFFPNQLLARGIFFPKKNQGGGVVDQLLHKKNEKKMD